MALSAFSIIFSRKAVFLPAFIRAAIETNRAHNKDTGAEKGGGYPDI